MSGTVSMSAMELLSWRLRALALMVALLYCGLAANVYYTHIVNSRVPQICECPKIEIPAVDFEPKYNLKFESDSYFPEVGKRDPMESGGPTPPAPYAEYDDEENGKKRRKRKVHNYGSRGSRHASQGGMGPGNTPYNAEESSIPGVEIYSNPQTKTTDDPDSVWLTSYSKIPVQVLQEFCTSTKDHCPPGDPGPPGTPGNSGLKGSKGDRGDRGIPGELGPRGSSGSPGALGPIGPKGERGSPGIDGREGLPGYPGLDGVPGRDGIHGLPGKDAIPGTPGTPGKPGTNGTNGTPGDLGSRGPQGPSGPPGLPGPRGRKGIPGKAGTPGVPGINAWKINGTQATKLLIPPSIVDIEQQTTVVVQEGEDIRLKCAASGTPEPLISWRREDNTAILMGSTYLSMIKGDRINFTRVNRDQIGTYLCIASNGVPPQAYKKTRLEVTFPPLIKIRNQMVATSNGSHAILECFAEAFPQAVNYWLYGDGRLLEPSWKYLIKQEEDSFRTHMILNITSIDKDDYGLYKCVSKNEKGKTLGVFTVFEMDPAIPARISPHQESTFTVYGEMPPPRIVETECKECAECPKQQRCPVGGKQDSIDVISVGGFHDMSVWHKGTRTKDCVIRQIGKPVFYRYTEAEFGAWMQDSHPSNTNSSEKFWVTLEKFPNHLYEYIDKNAFRKNEHHHVYVLPYSISGNSHVIYNGSFYYHRKETNQLVRFDLSNDHSSFIIVDDLNYQNDSRLYHLEHNYIDMAADENGIWVIFASNSSKNTKIMKLHPYSLRTEYMWNLTLNHHNVGDMFITCGVLYAVHSTEERNTHIDIAYDLHLNKPVDVKLNFTNPFRMTTMVSYNPHREIILSWDKGNQLVYPVKFGTIDLGQPDSDDDGDNNNDNDTK